MERRHFLGAMLGGGVVGVSAFGRGERSAAPATTPEPGLHRAANAQGRGDIIDVHLHAYPAGDAIPATPNPMTGKLPGVADGAAHRQACLAEMARLGIVTGVVSGGSGDRLAASAQWREAAPDRVLAGAGIRGSVEIPLPPVGRLRTAFTEKSLHVLGEVTAQYAGRSLDDPIYAPYLRLAEEVNVPVAVHMGIGPPGISHEPCCRGFRASLGNPAALETALNQYPKLRVNLMHGGWPYLADTIAVLSLYPNVYTDLGSIDWLLPRAEFHAYLAALVRAGLGRRILFGSDQMYWPDAIAVAVDAVDSANFLSPAERRDIFHDNAVRFLALDRATAP